MNELLNALAQHELLTGPFIVLESTADGVPTQIVEITDFDSIFGEALANKDAYAALVAADDNGDGTSKGYARFFDAWRNASVL